MTGPASVTELSNQELSALLAAVGRDRSIAAFNRLFRHYGPRVRAYVARQSRDRQVAEELMQETMLAVWNKAAQFDPERGSVSAWVFTIARNLRIDALRKDRRPDFDPEEPALLPIADLPADASLAARQEAELMHAAMAALPPEQRDLLKRSFFDDRSHTAIAAELAMPAGTVKSRIRLAFAKLRLALGDEA